MPMYLLAEDEGNEEEIMKLLESESPGGSPLLPDGDVAEKHPVNRMSTIST